MRNRFCVTPSPVPTPRGEPRISVVVLTHRRPAELARTLSSLCALPERPALVVVDNASGDATAALVRTRFPHATLVRADKNLGAAGRNLGAALAETRYVAFCDDDTTWEPGALARAADLLDAYPRVAALTARVLVGADGREDPTCRLMAQSPLRAPIPLPGPPILGLLAGATAFRRDAFVAAGGYHPRFFVGGEEALLALDLVRAGWWLVYARDLTVRHHPSAVRDARGRASVAARNAVWTAWLRYPLGAALTHTAALAPRVWRDGGGWRGWRRTLAGLPWALRARRAIPARVERMRRDVDAARRRSPS